MGTDWLLVIATFLLFLATLALFIIAYLQLKIAKLQNKTEQFKILSTLVTKNWGPSKAYDWILQKYPDELLEKNEKALLEILEIKKNAEKVERQP